MKCLYICMLVALLASPVRAEEDAQPAEETAATVAADPAIFCEEPSYDFGTQDSSQTVTHEFVILNKGDADLEILQARPSCGCTVANISQKIVPTSSSE